MDKKPIRILVADDHPIFREGLRALLAAESDLEIVGEVNDGAEAVDLTRKLRPDILLLDLTMPRMPGLETLRELAESATLVRTILLTAAIETRQIVSALQLGARGVIMKDAAVEVLFTGVRAVMAGQYWVGRQSVPDLMQALRSVMPAVGKPASPTNFGLTPREIEIVEAIVGGMTNRDIARSYGISEATVKHHLTSVFDKVGVSNRLELALFALNKGLVSPS